MSVVLVPTRVAIVLSIIVLNHSFVCHQILQFMASGDSLFGMDSTHVDQLPEIGHQRKNHMDLF